MRIMILFALVLGSLIGFTASASADDASWRLRLKTGDQFTYRIFQNKREDSIVMTLMEIDEGGRHHFLLNSPAKGKTAKEVYTPFGSKVSGPEDDYWWKQYGGNETYRKDGKPHHNLSIASDMRVGAKWSGSFDIVNDYGNIAMTRHITAEVKGVETFAVAGQPRAVKHLSGTNLRDGATTPRMVETLVDEETGMVLSDVHTWDGGKPGTLGRIATSMKLMPRSEKVTRK